MIIPHRRFLRTVVVLFAIGRCLGLDRCTKKSSAQTPASIFSWT